MKTVLSIGLPVLLMIFGSAASAQNVAHPSQTLFQNVQVFNGTDDRLYDVDVLVDGNPLEDISVIGTSSEWFTAPPREKGIPSIRLIMKDGKIFKDTL